MTLQLSPDFAVPVIVTSSQSLDRTGSAHALAGRIAGAPFGRVAISVHGDAIYASIHGAELGDFEIHRAPAGGVQVEKITPAGDLPCADDSRTAADTDADSTVAAPTASPSPSRSSRAATAGVVEDIAIFFNDQARVSVGGAPGVASDDADIRAKIQASIIDGNTALADSNIAVTLRAVTVHPIDYAYPITEGMDRALAELRDTSDGSLDQVHASRDQVGADIVSLWIDNNVEGGLANVNTAASLTLKNAFNVIRAKNPTATFVHEIGHNHGCRHLRDSYTTTPSSYSPDSFAHAFTTGDGGAFVTVVASTGDASRKGAIRILRFSAPELAYLGAATGQEGSANNAATVRTVSSLLADFRSAPESPSPTPTPGNPLPAADITPPTISLTGRSRIQTTEPRHVLRGTAKDDRGIRRVIYQLTGQRNFVAARGFKKWNLVVRPRIGRTNVKIIAVDTSGLQSSPLKVTIVRTR